MLKKIKQFYLGIILLFLYLPIGILVMYSFNESKSRANFTGFTFKWYLELLNDTAILNALYTTITIATLSAIIATVVGIFAAFGIDKMGKITKRITLGINNLPIINPDIVTGVSLMMFFLTSFKLMEKYMSFSMGFTTLLIANTIFNIPYVILSILPRLRSLNENLYEAAVDLGASPFQAFMKVILPEIMPSIVTGALLSFTMSIDDFVISYFSTGSGVNTLSMTIYTMTKRGINPKINALSTIMFIVVMILLLIINKRETSKSGKGDGFLNEV